MSLGVSIKLAPAAEFILRNAERAAPRLLQAVRREMDVQNELTVGHIIRERLTGKGPFPVDQHRLGVVTGRLRRSLRPSKARVVGMAVESAIGSNVEYFGKHEFGFEGSQNVRAHSRRVPERDEFAVGNVAINRRTAAGLGLNTTGKGRRRLLQVSSGVTRVRAHTRRLSIPARAPVQYGIDDRLGRYADALSEAIVREWQSETPTQA